MSKFQSDDNDDDDKSVVSSVSFSLPLNLFYSLAPIEGGLSKL